MSEVLAQLKKKGGSELELAAYGTYTNNSTINCNVGDIIVFMSNSKDTGHTYNNLNLLLIGPQITMDGGVTARMIVTQATAKTCSANLNLYTGAIYYSRIS